MAIRINQAPAIIAGSSSTGHVRLNQVVMALGEPRGINGNVRINNAVMLFLVPTLVMSVPGITLNIELLDFSGNEVGSVGDPAYVRVALCGFGPYLPRVAGTAMIGLVASWPGDIPYTGAPISVPLWGNDVITPVGTYYAISILDSNKNVIQTGAYVFTGIGTYNLNSISPTFPSYLASVMGSLVTVPYSATPTFDTTLVDGPLVFDLTLTGDVTAPILVTPFAGQLVTFVISQDATGSHAFVWPSNVNNPGVINPAANSVTTQTFIARSNGQLYPIGPQTYS